MTKKIQQEIALNEITDSLPIPWDEVIEELLSRSLPIHKKLSEGELALATIRVHNWKIALHWLIKWEWSKKHKIPGKRTIAKALESKGRFLQQIFYLCERCHTLQDEVPVDISYRHAAYWFGIVYWEMIMHEIYTVFETEKLKKGNKKEFVLSERRIEAQMLKERKNPLRECSPESDPMQATNKLMVSGIALANKSDTFAEKYWEPFVKAYTADNTRLDQADFGRAFIEQDKAYIQDGRGRGKRAIAPPEDLKTLLKKNGFLKPSPSKGFKN